MECHGICQSLDELIKSRSLHLNQIDSNMNPAYSACLCVNGAVCDTITTVEKMYKSLFVKK